MTTIVNSAAPTEERGGSGFLIGAVILVLFVFVLLYFGIPAINRMGPAQVNVPTPQINVAAPQVVVPDKVDVTVVPAE